MCVFDGQILPQNNVSTVHPVTQFLYQMHVYEKTTLKRKRLSREKWPEGSIPVNADFRI